MFVSWGLFTTGHALAIVAVLIGGALAFVGEVALVRDALVGRAIGAAVGKVVVRRRESLDGIELTARRVRQIEAAWIGIFASIALSSSLMVELFS